MIIKTTCTPARLFSGDRFSVTYRIAGGEKEAHDKAVGATLDEIMDTLLVTGSIAESSLYVVAFRKYKQMEGKMKKGKAGKGVATS